MMADSMDRFVVLDHFRAGKRTWYCSGRERLRRVLAIPQTFEVLDCQVIVLAVMHLLQKIGVAADRCAKRR